MFLCFRNAIIKLRSMGGARVNSLARASLPDPSQLTGNGVFQPKTAEIGKAKSSESTSQRYRAIKGASAGSSSQQNASHTAGGK